MNDTSPKTALPLYIPSKTRYIIAQFVKDAERLLEENVKAKYLFGSYATHTQTPLSDVDILIIVNHFTPDLQRQVSGLASDYSLEHDLYISPIVQAQEAWEKNERYKTLFYQEVMQHGIPL